jgi:hypothetical protein
MPQGRIVLKAICQSKKLADLKTDGARLLFTWLIVSVDVNGCFSADTAVIKGQIFTRLKHSPTKIKGFLDDLVSVGLIVVYDANGDQFLCIPDHKERQPHLNPEREAVPIIPPPTPDQLQTLSRVNPLKGKGKGKVEVKEKVKGFTPPTFDEVKKYITDNPELSNVNAETFFKGFNDSGWIDTQGKPVRNWKLKLRTWSSYGVHKTSGSPAIAPAIRGADGLTPRERMKKGLENG